jgi:hypothetical protein
VLPRPLPPPPPPPVQNDISCGIPESQVLALRFLPHLPADYLTALLDKGEPVGHKGVLSNAAASAGGSVEGGTVAGC